MSQPVVAEVYTGDDYNIKPSMGYAGIIPGVVTVHGLVSFHEVPPEYGRAWFDADIQCIPDIRDSYYSEAVDEVYNRIVGMWVHYVYPNGEEDGDCYMPISIFKEHIYPI